MSEFQKDQQKDKVEWTTLGLSFVFINVCLYLAIHCI